MNIIKTLMVGAFSMTALTMAAAEVQQNGNKVMVKPDGGQAKVICLEVMNDNIIRVRATSERALPVKKPSLMIVPQIAPAKTSGAVKRPEKCPPPLTSLKPL